MQRINPLFFLGVLFYSIFISACSSEKELPPPNILWIVSEDNSPLLGCYGDDLATSPNIDRLASKGILYTRAYANAPVCSPNRATLITGMYVSALGTEHMRSTYAIPDFVKFYPHYLRQAGYYTTNNAKEDYNTNSERPDIWNESSKTADYKNRKNGQPFFHIQNLHSTHESRLHWDSIANYHDPGKVKLPPYHPDTKEVRNDWAVYYDRIRKMDEQVGAILDDLEKQGLAENTIIFYYSDHGGALPRSKRFLFESGLRVPLIVRIPEKYKHLAPQAMGTKSDRLVSFIDLAPTLLSIAGTKVPEYMQGRAFLGQEIRESSPYSYAVRGRMDERIDLSRSITDGNYRYTRNYMPHRHYGQYLTTSWKAPAMRSWEEAYKNGTLNEVQSAFFKAKPYEELYDLKEDPHNVVNLADQASYLSIKKEFSLALDQWQIEQKDAGLIPEALLFDMDNIYEQNQDGFDVESILALAKKAGAGDTSNVDHFIDLLQNGNEVERYWANIGLTVLGTKAESTKENLILALHDSSAVVGIATAEALYNLGIIDLAVERLIKALDNENLMVRVQALNVLELMDENARPALQKIEALIEPKEQREYDNRLMWRIVEKLN
ncbi:MAG: sulfatase-like hydrolase/transferase [Bacteroidota bacterium]